VLVTPPEPKTEATPTEPAKASEPRESRFISVQDSSVPSLSELDMAIHELEPLSELDRAFAGLESGKANIPTDRALSRKSWGPATTAQPAVPEKNLTRSSTSKLPPVVSKTLPVKINSEVLDKSGQAVPLTRKSANVTSQSANPAGRMSGVKRGSKVFPSPQPPNPSGIASPTRLSKTTISPPQVQRKSNEKKEETKGTKAFVPFEEETVELTALEKDLQRLDGSKLTRKSANDIPTPSSKALQTHEHERRGIRSMSSPIPPDQTVRHLDLNWRSGTGKPADATILKYFPIVPAKQ
jgi:hypothetical protein